jgi:uncharacterized membrane protein YbhN (UPF0104 family)
MSDELINLGQHFSHRDNERRGGRLPNGKALIVLILKIAVFLVIGYLWYRYIRKNWSALSAQSWRLGWHTILLSSVVTLCGYVIRGWLWAPMRFELTGQRMTLAAAFRVSAIAWMGRYLPGKIWSVAGKAYLSARDKSQIPGLGVAVTIEILWLQLSAILLTVIVLALSPVVFLPAGVRAACLGAAMIGLVASHPRVFYPIANGLLTKLHQLPLTRRPRYRIMLLVMLGNMATFILWTGGFALLAGAISGIGFRDFPALIGIYSASWVIGFLMLLVPAGIGVRESMLAFGLRAIGAPDPAIITLVLLSRLLMTLIELGCFVAALLMPVLGFRPENAAHGGRSGG